MHKAVNNIYYKSEDKVKQIDELKKKLEEIQNREIDVNNIYISHTNAMYPEIDIDDTIYVNEDEKYLNEEDIFYLKLGKNGPFISRVEITKKKIRLITNIFSINDLVVDKNNIEVIGKVHFI